MTTIDELLKKTVELGGSDLHIKAGGPPLVRVHGSLMPMMGAQTLSPASAKELSYALLTAEQRARFEKDRELAFSHELPELARFRGNLYLQRGFVQSVYRVVPLHVRSMDELGLPPVCRFYTERPRGLVLVTGPAGSGKTTTLAAMIDHINKTSSRHIVTIEDPVEFVHVGQKALINQRELERDTRSFTNALRAVLRQDPDVILIGEMRDLETIALAITAAETGHLVFATLHTTNAVQTIDRVIDVFPTYQQQQIRMQLSVNLIGIVSQTLVRTADDKGRIAAFETLVGIPSVRALIREAKTYQIGSIIQTGMKQGMTTLDQSLASLVQRRVVNFETALEQVHNVAEFTFLCRGGEEPSLGKETPSYQDTAAAAKPGTGPIGQAPPTTQPKSPFGFRK
jgi:twitching motility protein PilT